MGNFHTFSDNFLVKPGFLGATSSGNQSGGIVDVLDYRRAAVLLNATTDSTTTFNFALLESSSSTFGSDTAAVSSSSLGSAQAAGVGTATVNDAYCLNVDLSKRKRYLRLRVTGTGSGGTVGAVWVLGQGELSAPTQDNSVVSV